MLCALDDFFCRWQVEQRLAERLMAGIHSWMCTLSAEGESKPIVDMDTDEPATVIYHLGGQPKIKVFSLIVYMSGPIEEKICTKHVNDSSVDFKMWICVCRKTAPPPGYVLKYHRKMMYMNLIKIYIIGL